MTIKSNKKTSHSHARLLPLSTISVSDVTVPAQYLMLLLYRTGKPYRYLTACKRSADSPIQCCWTPGMGDAKRKPIPSGPLTVKSLSP